MKVKILLCVSLVLFIGFSNLFASQPQKLVHNWECIRYPWILPDGKACPTFLAGFGEHPGEHSQGFKLDIMDITPGFFNTNHIIARLYRANGEIVEPTEEGKELLNAPAYISTVSIPGKEPNPQVMTYFPWGTNSLEESWIEVTMGTERYWVEIPYGFDRNPNDPLSPSIQDGPPKFVPAMKSLTDHDHEMRWQTVHYDLGALQNGWRLSLIQSNSTNAESEVVLFPEAVKMSTATSWNATSWKTNSPAAALWVLDATGRIIGSHCIDIGLQSGGMGYRYDLAQNGDNLRCWGQIEISVGNKTYGVVVPSSLYKYVHGHALAD